MCMQPLPEGTICTPDTLENTVDLQFCFCGDDGKCNNCAATCPATAAELEEDPTTIPGFCIGRLGFNNEDQSTCGDRTCDNLCRTRCQQLDAADPSADNILFVLSEYSNSNCNNDGSPNCGGNNGQNIDPAINPLTGGEMGGPCCRYVPPDSIAMETLSKPPVSTIVIEAMGMLGDSCDLLTCAIKYCLIS